MRARKQSDLSVALHDLGDSTRHAAAEVADAAGERAVAVKDVVVEKAGQALHAARSEAVDVRDTVSDHSRRTARRARKAAKQSQRAAQVQVATGRQAASTQASAARDAARNQALAAKEQALAAQSAVKEQAKAAKRSASKRRAATLAAASALLDDVDSKARSAVGRPKPKKQRGRRLLKAGLVVAVVAGVIAVARAVRPKQTARTGSSIPPKVRPVPTPSDAAVGGAPVSGTDQPTTADSSDQPVPSDSGAPGAAPDDVPPGDDLVWTTETDRRPDQDAPR